MKGNFFKSAWGTSEFVAPFSKHLQLDDSKGSDEQQEPTSCWSSIRIGPLQLLFFYNLNFHAKSSLQ